MKKLAILLLSIVLLTMGCCKEKETTQQVTYRLTVTDVGYKMWYNFDDYTDNVFESGIYDTTMIKQIGDTCFMRVRGTCSNDQRQEFDMQLLVNGIECVFESYSNNAENSFDCEIRYIVKL